MLQIKFFLSALRIRDVYPGSEFFPSRISPKNLSILNKKNAFQALGI